MKKLNKDLLLKREMLIIENFKKVSKQLKMLNEEEKWADDGGYYNKPKGVSYEDNKTIDTYKNEIVNHLNKFEVDGELINEILNGKKFNVYINAGYELGINSLTMATRIKNNWYSV